ncbi:MAG: DNA polymerase III subunit beta [Acidiferrobacteraceae bacterium]
MHIRVPREDLLKPLALVANIVDRRQIQPILSHILLQAEEYLDITGTDLEVEIKSRIPGIHVVAGGAVTVPGRKFFDIVRALPALIEVDIRQEGERLVVKARTSRFSLATLPARDFPNIESSSWGHEIAWTSVALRRLLEKCHFCMAQQDARYFLNGLLIDVGPARVRVVTTDGHRLAVAEQPLGVAVEPFQVIVPRKGVMELLRLLGDGVGEVTTAFNTNHIRVQSGTSGLISKLIDGRFPDYEKVIPPPHKTVVRVSRLALKESLARAAILASEKYRGVRLALTANHLTLTAQNPDQEEAREEIAVDYTGEEIELGFNVGYLADAVAALDGDEIELGLSDANSSITLRMPGSTDLFYVIMPMRL